MSESGGAHFGATGEHTLRGVPHGVTSITPYVSVPDVGAAIAFYERVFDARVVEATRVDDVVIHAQLDMGNGHLHVEAPNPTGGLSPPPSDRTACFALGYYCDDVDALVTRARAAGAQLLAPAVHFASGDRFAQLQDSHGIRWSIMSRVEDLSESESAERVAAWVAGGRAAD